MIVKKNTNYEYYLRPPREQKYYQIMGNAAVFFHISHHSWWGLPRILKLVKFHYAIFIFVALPCLLLEILYLYTKYDELTFATKGTMFSLIPVTAITNIKIAVTMVSSYKSVMVKLMDEIHIYNFLGENKEFIKKKLIEVERKNRWVTTFLVVFMFMDWLLWVISPILNNIKNKELVANRTMRLETCLYLWMPFEYGYEFRKWLVTHALNVYLVFVGGMTMAVMDSVNFIFIFHFLGHVDILKHMITTYFAVPLNDKDTKEKIVEIIKYHSFVLSVFDNMQAGFGMNVALNYLQNLVNDSLLLYQIMMGDKGNRVVYLFMMLFHMGGLTLMSCTLEQIRIKVPWEKMSINNQKLLIPIMLKMQKTLIFEGSCGLQTGVRPLVNIVKSTFSYYVMLKSTI
ncbi:uncharacterized protein isoform X2 [Choristoneura fumiferana]|uniref:uncharacterized protein isoform X2 n=1 Tax=Choristoneura fumiferana TaxID=7141 RepID=UPI003D15A08C